MTLKKLFAILAICTSLLLFQACDDGDEPLEETGENIEEAAEETSDAVEETAEETADEMD